MSSFNKISQVFGTFVRCEDFATQRKIILFLDKEDFDFSCVRIIAQMSRARIGLSMCTN